MNKETSNPYMVRISDAMVMFSNGRNRMIEDAVEAGAYLRKGRRCFIIVDKMKDFYANLAIK